MSEIPPPYSRFTVPELPEHLVGLEDLIAEMAYNIGHQPQHQIDFEAGYAVATAAVERRIAGYHALAKIATNPRSLAYRLKQPEQLTD